MAMSPSCTPPWFLAALAQASSGDAGLAPGGTAPVAVAVSGGADSMALALLAAGTLGKARIRALTVDHRLRAESAAEAAQVARWMADAGIAHQILVWEGEKPAGNVQQAARLARYRLMEDWCAAHGVAWLLLGHHQGDQAETLLLRLARGSGVDGLAAMAPARPALTRADGPVLLRPLLDMPPDALRGYLNTQGAGWVEDPSNRNLDYDRVRARALLADPPLAGLTPRRLAGVAASMRRARTALEHYTGALLAQAVVWHPTGHAVLDRAAFLAVPEEIALRGLAVVAARAGGRAMPPRLEQVMRLAEAMRAARGMARTLAGVRILVPAGSGGRLIMTREPAAAGRSQLDLAAGAAGVWDGRFLIGLGAGARPCRVRALGAEGWRQIKRTAKPPVPYDIALSQPGLWRQGRLVAAPTLDYHVGDNHAGREPADWLTCRPIHGHQRQQAAVGLVYGGI